MGKVWDEKLGCFADDTKESTKKIVNAYFPWNEDLAKEAKLDVPLFHHGIKHKQIKDLRCLRRA
jgi:hypothetical protein